jgi:hypothetical protein
MSETLATQLSQGGNGIFTKVDIDGESCEIAITKA